MYFGLSSSLGLLSMSINSFDRLLFTLHWILIKQLITKRVARLSLARNILFWCLCAPKLFSTSSYFVSKLHHNNALLQVTTTPVWRKQISRREAQLSTEITFYRKLLLSRRLTKDNEVLQTSHLICPRDKIYGWRDKELENKTWSGAFLGWIRSLGSYRYARADF